MGKEKKNRNKNEGKEAVEDRFSAAETRPQFRTTKQNQNKVVLDERFTSVLTDPRFQLQEKDKYGRRSKKKQAAKEELSAFYTVEEEAEEGKKKERDEDKDDDASSASGSSRDSEDPAKEKKEESESEEENEDPASRIAYLTSLSRGEVDAESSSDDDEASQSSDDDDDEDGEDPVYGTAGVLDPSNQDAELEVSYEDSPYLVVTNMDWGNVKAVDLFSILSSFTPPGAVKRVQIYHSDFGMEQTEKDRLSGPSGIWKKKDQDGDNENMSEDESEDESEGSAEGSDEEDMPDVQLKIEHDHVESDFDPEKLRAYEASKLKYFFAVVTFADAEHANIAYREVDGLEFEHSSSAIDLRTLSPDALDGVVTDRPMRDESISVPSNYEPPDFVISALQQTKVQCTWDQGDVERERKLTKYGSTEWQEMAEADDLKAYLASDGSSDEDSDDEKANKSSTMRKLLGLDSDDEDKESGSEQADSSDEGEVSDREEMSKEITYIPGNKNLEEKIRSKLQLKNEPKEDLSPWEKYQEKRKQRRKDRKQAVRDKGRGLGKDQSNDDEAAVVGDDDDFFMDEGKKNTRKSKPGGKTKDSVKEVKEITKDQKAARDQKSKQELELLLAGENDEEQARDFDIRGIQRMDKNKGKKLRGSRKRKEDKLASDVSGANFKVNVDDSRFAAVLEGADDRFGIDKTDANYKETPAMRDILASQSTKRKKKRQRSQSNTVAPDVNAESNAKSAGASALSSLVKRLKSKVSKTNHQ